MKNLLPLITGEPATGDEKRGYSNPQAKTQVTGHQSPGETCCRYVHDTSYHSTILPLQIVTLYSVCLSSLAGIYHQSISQNGTRMVEQNDQHPVRSISSPVTPSSVNLTYQIKGIMPLEHQNFAASFQVPFASTAGHHHHYHQLVSHPHIHSTVIHENNSTSSSKSDAAGAQLAVSPLASLSHQDTASGHEKNPSPGVCM